MKKSTTIVPMSIYTEIMKKLTTIVSMSTLHWNNEQINNNSFNVNLTLE